MKHSVVGVIGHVDHGKTALVRALTGQETDRLPEEKERGISIALGFAHLHGTGDSEIDLIDMPGHERFVRTMIGGATGIDAVLLVVAANEGVMPQTIEHVDIAGLLGIGTAIIAITKADLVSHDEAALVSDDAARLARAAGLEVASCIVTSTRDGRGLDRLRAALVSNAERAASDEAEGIPYLPIDRAFSVAGHGPVVAGTLRGGAIRTGDVLELLPAGREIRVKAIEVRGQRTTCALPGQRTALNLRDVAIADLSRGMALAPPAMLARSTWLTLSIRALKTAAPLRNGARVLALLGTSQFDVRLRLLDRDVLDAGESGFAQLHFTEPVASPARQHVILRRASPPSTLAGGVILDPNTVRQRRHDPMIVNELKRLGASTRADVIAAEVHRAGGAGISVARLSQLTALAPARVAYLLQRLPVVITRSEVVVETSRLEDLSLDIVSRLSECVDGSTHEELVRRVPGCQDSIIEEALQRLIARGLLERHGGKVRVLRPDKQRARERREADAALRLESILLQAGLTPPTSANLIDSVDAKRAADRLLRSGLIVRTVDRVERREFLFHNDAVEDAKRRLRPILQDRGGLLVGEIAAALNITRKHTIPLVEYFDRTKFTQRVGDRHVAARPTIPMEH